MVTFDSRCTKVLEILPISPALLYNLLVQSPHLRCRGQSSLIVPDFGKSPSRVFSVGERLHSDIYYQTLVSFTTKGVYKGTDCL